MFKVGAEWKSNSLWISQANVKVVSISLLDIHTLYGTKFPNYFNFSRKYENYGASTEGCCTNIIHWWMAFFLTNTDLHVAIQSPVSYAGKEGFSLHKWSFHFFQEDFSLDIHKKVRKLYFKYKCFDLRICLIF